MKSLTTTTTTTKRLLQCLSSHHSINHHVVHSSVMDRGICTNYVKYNMTTTGTGHHSHHDSNPSSLHTTHQEHTNATGSPVDLSTVYDFARQPSAPITLNMVMNFGLKLNKQTLLNSSHWLKEELPKRLGRQVRQLDNLPNGLNLMPSVRLVRDWYMASFNDIYYAKKPKTMEEELHFTKILQGIFTRHHPTMISVAKGVNELKMKLRESIYQNDANFDLAEFSELHTALDSFYINRIGMRMLIGQHLALHEQLTKPMNGYAGLICMNTNPLHVAKDAIEDAADLCRMSYGDAPEVVIIGRTDLEFPYVPSHLYYIFFELLKNSMRAVVENHQGKSLPKVNIIIADGGSDKENISIKISDEGKGIPRKDMHKIWSYLYTTAKVNQDMTKIEEFTDSHAPLAGFGYGLPLSRLYAKYWGGDLNVMSMQGFGTDCYLYLHCLGDKEEVIH